MLKEPCRQCQRGNCLATHVRTRTYVIEGWSFFSYTYYINRSRSGQTTHIHLRDKHACRCRRRKALPSLTDLPPERATEHPLTRTIGFEATSSFVGIYGRDSSARSLEHCPADPHDRRGRGIEPEGRLKIFSIASCTFC